MTLKRKTFQGVVNIIRFNWHFYLLATTFCFLLIYFKSFFSENIQTSLILIAALIGITAINSLLVSFYVYDLSKLYKLKWIKNLEGQKILNLTAGFDEISNILKNKVKFYKLIVCDFYNSIQNPEISIKRAHRVYPSSTNTIFIKTTKLPFSNHTFDQSILFFSAHEIRNKNKRIEFFKELARITKTEGQILVTEHLRDWKNFLAYTIGFFHFYSKKNWLHVFEKAGLHVKKEIKTTPFVSTFILSKNGTTL